MIRTRGCVLVVLALLLAASTASAGAPEPFAPAWLQTYSLGMGGGTRITPGGPFSPRSVVSPTFAMDLRIEELFAVHRSVALQPLRLGVFLGMHTGATGFASYSIGAAFDAPMVGTMVNYLGLNASTGVVLLRDMSGLGGLGGAARIAMGFHHFRAQVGFNFGAELFTEARYISEVSGIAAVIDLITGVAFDCHIGGF